MDLYMRPVSSTKAKLCGVVDQTILVHSHALGFLYTDGCTLTLSCKSVITTKFTYSNPSSHFFFPKTVFCAQSRTPNLDSAKDNLEVLLELPPFPK